jgi:hypothetical protein
MQPMAGALRRTVCPRLDFDFRGAYHHVGMRAVGARE